MFAVEENPACWLIFCTVCVSVLSAQKKTSGESSRSQPILCVLHLCEHDPLIFFTSANPAKRPVGFRLLGLLHHRGRVLCDLLSAPTMPFFRMPAVMLRPVALGPGEPGYEDWKKAARAKFNAYDYDKNGWLTDEEAIDLAVDLYATLHKTANLKSAEAREITAKLLMRLGHVDEKIVFAEFLLWFRTAVDKIYRIDAAHGCVNPSEKQVSVPMSAGLCACACPYSAPRSSQSLLFRPDV